MYDSIWIMYRSWKRNEPRSAIKSDESEVLTTELHGIPAAPKVISCTQSKCTNLNVTIVLTETQTQFYTRSNNFRGAETNEPDGAKRGERLMDGPWRDSRSRRRSLRGCVRFPSSCRAPAEREEHLNSINCVDTENKTLFDVFIFKKKKKKRKNKKNKRGSQ